MEIRCKNLFENKEKALKLFKLRIQTLLNEIKISDKIIRNTTVHKTVPWTIKQPTIKLDLSKLSITKTPHHLARELPQHQNQFLRPPHLYRWIQTGNASWLCCCLPKPRTVP